MIAGNQDSEHSTGYENFSGWEVSVSYIDLDGTLKLMP